MKICPNCGNQVADEALFCNNCGTNVSSVESAAENTTGAASDESRVASETIGAAATAANVAGGAFSGTAQAQDFTQSQDFSQPQAFTDDQASYQNQYRSYDPSDHTAEFDPRDIADNKLFAVIPYFTLLYGLVIALLCKESAFTKFHAKNALRLKIAGFLALIPSIIPLLGWFVTFVLLLILAVIHIIAIVQCFQGKAKELPIVSNIGFLR